MREEGKAPKNRWRKREAEEAHEVEVASGVNVGWLRRFRTALIGPTQGLSEAALAAPIGNPEKPESMLLGANTR